MVAIYATFQIGSFVVSKELHEVAAPCFLLFLRHVQLMLHVLPWRVDSVLDEIAVVRENVHGLVTNLADSLFPLWQTFQVDSPFSFFVVDESVEEYPRNLT